VPFRQSIFIATKVVIVKPHTSPSPLSPPLKGGEIKQASPSRERKYYNPLPWKERARVRGIGVNLRRKIMDLIEIIPRCSASGFRLLAFSRYPVSLLRGSSFIKSPSLPLYQRGMFYDSPLWQRGRVTSKSLFLQVWINHENRWV